jgi:Xaa-Pro aminopeptidase
MYIDRLHKLQLILREHGIHGMLLCQNVDLYYFIGCMQTGYLFVPDEGEAVFLVRRSLDRAREESAVRVVEWRGMKHFRQQLEDECIAWAQKIKNVLIVQIALEFDVLPVQQYVRLQQSMPDISWIDGSLFVKRLRSQKSNGELESIAQAAHVVNEAFHEALQCVRPGITELQLMTILEQQLRLRGHLGPLRMRGMNQEIYTGLVCAGANGAIPTYFDGPTGGGGMSAAFPQGAGHQIISMDEPVLIDIGCNIDGYTIDQTRTVVIGKLSDTLGSAYQLAQSILFELETMLKPGVVCETLHMRALEIAENAGLDMNFMGFGANRVKFVGHGIGLEIDEWPVLAKGFKEKLLPGMVIAIEPKFVFPGLGVVGIEDSYVITESGFRRLSVTEQKLFTV